MKVPCIVISQREVYRENSEARKHHSSVSLKIILFLAHFKIAMRQISPRPPPGSDLLNVCRIRAFRSLDRASCAKTASRSSSLQELAGDNDLGTFCLYLCGDCKKSVSNISQAPEMKELKEDHRLPFLDGFGPRPYRQSLACLIVPVKTHRSWEAPVPWGGFVSSPPNIILSLLSSGCLTGFLSWAGDKGAKHRFGDSHPEPVTGAGQKDALPLPPICKRNRGKRYGVTSSFFRRASLSSSPPHSEPLPPLLLRLSLPRISPFSVDLYIISSFCQKYARKNSRKSASTPRIGRLPTQYMCTCLPTVLLDYLERNSVECHNRQWRFYTICGGG